MLILFAANWRMSGRAAAALGLGAPTTTPAVVGPAVAAALLAMMGAMVRRRSSAVGGDVEQTRRDLLPEPPGKSRLFLLLSVAVGFGWKVLNRSSLLFYLEPRIDLAAGVIAAAVAYGVADGFEGWGRLAASIAAALAVTIGYAATSNLWWLILLHTVLALLGLSPIGREARIEHWPLNIPS